MMTPQTPELMLDVGLLFSFLFNTVIQPKEKIFLLAKCCSFLGCLLSSFQQFQLFTFSSFLLLFKKLFSFFGYPIKFQLKSKA